MASVCPAPLTARSSEGRRPARRGGVVAGTGDRPTNPWSTPAGRPYGHRMPPWENLLAFTLTALVIVAVPGPSVLFVIGRSLAWGRRGGVLSVVGNALGMLPAVFAVAL